MPSGHGAGPTGVCVSCAPSPWASLGKRTAALLEQEPGTAVQGLLPARMAVWGASWVRARLVGWHKGLARAGAADLSTLLDQHRYKAIFETGWTEPLLCSGFGGEAHFPRCKLAAHTGDHPTPFRDILDLQIRASY